MEIELQLVEGLPGKHKPQVSGLYSQHLEAEARSGVQGQSQLCSKSERLSSSSCVLGIKHQQTGAKVISNNHWK